MSNIVDIYELSPMQQGFLFHSLYAPQSGVYFEQLSCELKGKLNISFFKKAWQQVVSRHPVLRTSFYWEEVEKPLQVVYSDVDLAWEEFNWISLTPIEQQEKLEDFFLKDREQGFQLTQAPLMRFALIQMQNNVYHFVWSYHHLLMDGWCMSIIFKEVLAFYEAFEKGQNLYLKTPPPYRNYIAWLQKQNPSQAETFWRQILKGFNAPTPLISSTTASGQLNQTYNHQNLQLSAAITTALQTSLQQQHLTLNTVVQGVWALLLSYYSGEPDVVFGTTVSGRPPNLCDVESMVGLFINTLPLRAQISKDIEIVHWLQKLQTQLVELQHYSYSQLVDIQGWSEVPRGTSLFESIVVFENYPVDASLQEQNGDLLITNVKTFEQTNYPLILTAIPGTELSLRITYDTHRFDTATITRMLGHFQNLLEGITANLKQPVANLSLLTSQERHQLLVEWNNTQKEYPDSKCIHELFEEQVQRTPNAIAVVSDFENQQLSYKQLNQRANQLAHYLKSLGVGSGQLIGLCVERSLELVVGLLGISKAGAAYVPLDPDYPQERLAYMLDNSQASVLLTQQKLVSRLPQHKAKAVYLDAEWEVINTFSQENTPITNDSSKLAYVIYTSGSTGQPKGVMISHTSIVNHISWMQEYFPLTKKDKVLQQTAFSFDPSIWEFYAPLLAGAQLVIAQPGGHQDSAYIINTIVKHKIPILQVVPTLLRMLLESGSFNTCKSLKHVFCGGETLPPELIQRFYENLDANLCNLYGPTEATIDTTFFTCKRDNYQQIVPIGRPINNAQVYILDADLQLVPIGVAGELHIGGVGLADGYLNQSSLTNEKFIPNPFNQNSKLYKTGDLVRYLADGNIEYLGRIDNQVKIRGFRIELGEIEARLATHPQVKQSAVILREDKPTNKRLVAYIVPEVVPEKLLPSNSQLRDFLKQQLPEYMIPNAFVTLDKLPLSPNGKIDRHALPAPDIQLNSDNEFTPPSTPTEEIIANIFAEVLEVSPIGRYNNFFELGGHSLLATQVISRLRQTFSVDLPLRCLFESPTVAELDVAIKAYRRTEPELPPLEPVSRDTILPLSWGQKRLWFLNQLEGESAAYNMPIALQITGTLNVNAFQQAWTEIIQRHEVLRTCFQEVDSIPTQVIYPVSMVNLPVLDLQKLPASEQSKEVQRLALEAAQKPFDLSKGDLIRVNLLHLSEESYVLLLVAHHIIFDGWSMKVIVKELSSLYQAYCDGQPNPLSQLPIQYADFAVWQQKWLSGETYQAKLNYWKQQLASAAPILELPTDKPRPPVQTFQGSSKEFQLDINLTKQIKALSQKSGATLFMTLEAAFVVLLHRYSGSDDILVGTPIANRNHQQIESLIGFFVNTLVLRTQIQDNPTFSDLLTQTRSVALDAYAYQDVPFEQVVEAVQPQRNLSHSPLFQVMFILQNAPIGRLQLPGLTFNPLEIKNVAAKYDLTLSMEETEQGLIGSLQYNSDLFNPETIARMIGHLQNLLQAIVANPEQSIKELPLLTDREKHQLLVEWNNTQKEYPFEKCIHQLFEEQVQRTPDAIAVVFGNEHLTYKVLNQRANQLAHYLQSLGVQPEVLVGICTQRSLEMIVGLLGILKAGAAYVPLDPEYPQERLAYMLRDSSVKVLLTQQKLLHLFPHQNNSNQNNIVCLDADQGEISGYSNKNPVIDLDSSNLAYVIYTSGSTGEPKGVQISHQSVVNFLDSMYRCPGLTDSDILFAVTTISFDIAALELYLPLIVGAKVVMASREITSDGTKLLNQLVECGTTIMQATPATWQMLLASGWSNKQPLKVLCGGEALPAKLATLMQETGSEVWNLYGPTETTIWSAIQKLEQTEQIETPIKDTPECIGRPIANTQIYILDSLSQLVPVGIPGELHIGGVGLARGYLNRPELNKEKFIPNPFDNNPKSRLYKTGDLARYLPDGKIEYLGRIDNQVKIRGFRIEVGEIEALLDTHPQIQQAVVIPHEEQVGNKYLVAYLVPNSESPTTSELRSFLKQKLPDYMLPNVFVTLDTLPLTPNSKINRRALPAPDTKINHQDNFVAPRTPSEEVIAKTFAEALNIEKLGIHENFFELGGHSLLATQIISRLRETFALDLPLRCIFESPTVAELDEFIKTHRHNGLRLTPPPIVPVSRDIELPLSWAQTRLWFLDKLDEQSASYNMPQVVQINGDLKLNALERAVSEIVRRHEVLRTNFQEVDGSPVQVIAPATAVNILKFDLQNVPEDEKYSKVRQLVTEQAQEPFCLSSDPLLRVAILQLAENSHVLLLVMHHIITDAWSMGIFIRELSTLYKAFLSGEANPLSELPIQYADFSLWQQKWLSGEAYEAQLNYWQQQLADAPPLLELPTSKPRPPLQTYEGGRQKFQIPTELYQKLKKLSQKSGTTLFMTLQAAFVILLHRYTAQDDILIGTPIANRSHPELEPLIGFFVNTLVLRTNLQGNPSFTELLNRVRSVALEAYEHQDIPFEQVVEAVQPERNLSNSPLFQVMFDLQNLPIGELELSGLTLTPLSVEDVTAKFDLTLSMEETEDLRGTWEYNSDLFDDNTIARMVCHFQTLLEAIVTNPQLSIAELSMLTDAERHQLLVEWNDTKTEYTNDKCIHELFEQQVQLTPDAVAVVFASEQLTYFQLNSRANQLAHYLQSQGVRPDVLVGICMERSLDMIVGLLAVLKAGGAYVPLDPAYPQERLQFMISDARISVLLTQEKLVSQIPQHSASVVCLDTDWEVISQNRQENPVSAAIPSNLVYVIYTSGSTGTPKGVAIAHSSLVNTYLAWEDSYQLRATTSSHLQMASISFDVFSGDLVRALCSGSKLVICPREWILAPGNLYKLMQEQKVDCADFVPAVFRNLVGYLEKTNQNLKFMRLIAVGSDSWHVKDYEEFRRFCGSQTRLINPYGVTEATIDSCYFESTQVDLYPDRLVPIGRPFANTQLYILDRHQQPLPVGIPGELHIGGLGLARGYVNRPELTTSKFIPDIFSNNPESRLYKTGDSARYLADGNIEFLGRIDNQVKVRGFRIELGEIEGAIAQYPGVKQAITVVREDQPGDQRLVAYITSNSTASLCTRELRSFLKQKLPNYMVPNAFVTLDAMPLSANGKIDRSSLPVPSITAESDNFVPPRTPTEETVSSIMAEVLQIERVGVYDNFFELGGHSLLATQVISRLQRVFSVDLPLRTIFESVNVAEFAETIVNKQLEQADSDAIAKILAEIGE